MTQNSLNATKPFPIAKGGTNQTTFVNSGVVYYDGTSLNSTLAGVSGQALTSNGPSAAPSFQNQAGGTGVWTLLQTQSVSGAASVNFTSTGSFKTHALVFSQVYCPGIGTSSDMDLVFSTNGGSSYVTSGYQTNMWYLSGSGAISNMAVINGYPTTYIWLSTGIGANLASTSICGTAWIYGLNTTAGTPSAMCSNWNSKGVYQLKAIGWLATAGLYNALQVYATGGGLFTGTFSLFGIVQ